jgi:hypothetical protein
MLLDAARELFSNVSASDLARDYQTLSDLYRRELPTPANITRGEVAAYAAARLPATSAVVARVLREVRACIPNFRPMTVLDLGAGLGAAGWAAAECFPSVAEVDFVERAPRMLAAGRSLSASSPIPAVARARWHAADATSQRGVHDLVMASYLFAELPPWPVGHRAVVAEHWRVLGRHRAGYSSGLPTVDDGAVAACRTRRHHRGSLPPRSSLPARQQPRVVPIQRPSRSFGRSPPSQGRRGRP